MAVLLSWIFGLFVNLGSCLLLGFSFFFYMTTSYRTVLYISYTKNMGRSLVYRLPQIKGVTVFQIIFFNNKTITNSNEIKRNKVKDDMACSNT